MIETVILEGDISNYPKYGNFKDRFERFPKLQFKAFAYEGQEERPFAEILFLKYLKFEDVRSYKFEKESEFEPSYFLYAMRSLFEGRGDGKKLVRMVEEDAKKNKVSLIGGISYDTNWFWKKLDYTIDNPEFRRGMFRKYL
ncbi:hypothetical protein GF361_04625 [Candidatus Woesearchaeota archaeon]|nr:hypothetical protein [Candidatus Woesearchaeota archaeon]